MLILSRRFGESIIIGDNEVRITIIGIHGRQVKMGILAPPEISVHREEIYERILAEREINKEEIKKCHTQ